MLSRWSRLWKMSNAADSTIGGQRYAPWLVGGHFQSESRSDFIHDESDIISLQNPGRPARAFNFIGSHWQSRRLAPSRSESSSPCWWPGARRYTSFTPNSSSSSYATLELCWIATTTGCLDAAVVVTREMLERRGSETCPMHSACMRRLSRAFSVARRETEYTAEARVGELQHAGYTWRVRLTAGADVVEHHVDRRRGHDDDLQRTR